MLTDKLDNCCCSDTRFVMFCGRTPGESLVTDSVAAVESHNM